MRPLYVLFASLGLPIGAIGAQGATAQPDVFLAPLTIEGRSLRIGTPANVTARPGYDNQPSFSPDGRWMFFTSTREDAQADIYS